MSSCRRRSGSAPGRSILLRIGMIDEAGVEREEEVRQRLGLDALRGVDDENRALARRERPRHFVREVDVTRGVDQVELVRHAVGARRNSCGRHSA